MAPAAIKMVMTAVTQIPTGIEGVFTPTDTEYPGRVRHRRPDPDICSSGLTSGSLKRPNAVGAGPEGQARLDPDYICHIEFVIDLTTRRTGRSA